MRIAAYLRKSVKGDENSISIDAQLEIIKNYFNKEKCKYIVYTDDGFSGGSTNRPAFQKMIDDAHNNKFDAVACYKLDRMARNTLDFLNTFDELQKIGVDLVCVQDNYDPRTPAGKMMMTLLASLAEMERENIKRRAIDGMYSLAKQGRWSGGTPPYGCVASEGIGGKYLEIEKKEEILYIFNQFSIGNSMWKISKRVGITPRNLGTVLRNPIYLISDKISNKYLSTIGYKVIGEPNGNGYMTYKYNKFIKDKMVNLAVITQNKGIINSTLWIKVRERLRALEHVPPRISTKSWLAHKIICKQCNKIMSINYGSIRKDGTRPMYFRCKKNCFSGIRVDEIEDKIFSTLKNGNLEKVLNKNDENIEFKIAENIEKQLKKKKKMYDGFLEKSALASTVVAKSMLDKAEQLSLEIEELNVQYTKYQIVLNNKSKKDEMLKNKELAKDEFVKHFNKINLEDKQNLINIIFDKLVWDGDNLLIY